MTDIAHHHTENGYDHHSFEDIETESCPKVNDTFEFGCELNFMVQRPFDANFLGQPMVFEAILKGTDCS